MTSPRSRSERLTPDGKAVILDGLDEYAGALLGGPPPGFNELLDLMRKLHPLVVEATGFSLDEEVTDVGRDRMRDAALLLAYSFSAMRNEGHGEHSLSFVQRAKQVVQWCKRPINLNVTPLEMLENKARELARLISARLFPEDGFTLLLYNNAGGHMTWISSAGRNDTIEIIRNMVEGMAADQKRRS